MKVIQQWTLIICLASLTAALVQSILPNGSMERMGRFVMGAFLICAMIEPLSKFIPSLRVSLQSSANSASQENTEIQSTVNSEMKEEAEKSVTRLVMAELARTGIKCKNVQVDMDTTAGSSINISKVIVRLNKSDAAKTTAAKEYLEKELGLKTEVVTDGG